MHDRADQYRKQADLCRQVADASTFQPSIDAWLEMAEHWRVLANASDRSENVSSPPPQQEQTPSDNQGQRD